MVDYVVSKEGTMSFKFAFSGTVAFTPYTFLGDNGMELKFTKEGPLDKGLKC